MFISLPITKEGRAKCSHHPQRLKFQVRLSWPFLSTAWIGGTCMCAVNAELRK